MINEIKQDAEVRMTKAVESVVKNFKKIRTGRANPAIFDNVMVSYYGNDTVLNQVANISVEDGRTLAISPWEKHLVPDIEKAILKSDLGLNPSTTGDTIRVSMPPLTEETRKEFIKQARAEAENGKIAIRNIRRDANGDLKSLLKEKELSEDEERGAQDQVQKLTDKYVAEIDKILAEKEVDLMKV